MDEDETSNDKTPREADEAEGETSLPVEAPPGAVEATQASAEESRSSASLGQGEDTTAEATDESKQNPEVGGGHGSAPAEASNTPESPTLIKETSPHPEVKQHTETFKTKPSPAQITRPTKSKKTIIKARSFSAGQRISEGSEDSVSVLFPGNEDSV